jgi:hypothetical protein
MVAPTIQFRPFIEATSLYDTGLSNVALNENNQLANAASVGYGIKWGVSGSHSWKRSYLGLEYSGGFTQYDGKATIPHSQEQTFLLGINHRFSRHIRFSLRNSAGFFTRDYTLAGLARTVPFDPSQSYIPTTDFFDNRTIYLTSQADVTIEKSARTSVSLGGDAFINRRHSKALSDTDGFSARADLQYRASKTITIGAHYTYAHYSFTGVSGGTDMHGASFVFSMRPSRWVEFSGYGGVMRIESKFIRQVPIDPLIAQLLGIGQASQIFHTITYAPQFAGRLSRQFRTGTLYGSGGRSIMPGNGLFLTSIATTAMGGYTFTGVRSWSLNAQAGLNRAEASGNLHGRYNTYTASTAISRKLGRALHLTMRYTARQYSSGDFSQYNRLIYTAAVGISFAPGDVPLRLW